MKKFLLLVTLLISSLMMISCKAEVSLQLNKNGSVDIHFSSGAGKAFTQMILAASDGEQAVFDVDEITYQLGINGFTKINVQPKGVVDIAVSMSDPKRSSYLFTSGICSVSDNKLKVNIDAEKLNKFYTSSNEMLQMVMDLLLAPVFNDEVMEENEYLEVVSSFYGESAAEELRYSDIKFTIIQPDGKKTEKTIPMVKILTLTSPIQL